MKKENVLILLISLMICLNVIIVILFVKSNIKVNKLEHDINEIRTNIEEQGLPSEEFYDGGTYDESLDNVYEDNIYVPD
jgi:hypothetical protein